jgi:hypothetical protein
MLILSERDNIAGTGTQGQVHQVGFAPNSFSNVQEVILMINQSKVSRKISTMTVSMQG